MQKRRLRLRKAPPIIIQSSEGPISFNPSESGSFRHGLLHITEMGVISDGGRGDGTSSTPIIVDGMLVDPKMLHSVGLVGQGSSGVVEKTTYAGIDRLLAVKHITVFDDAKRAQMMMELQLLLGIHDPHIVEFYGAFYNEGTISLVLEYMDGNSLSTMIHQCGPLPEALIAKVCEQVLQGLHYLHKMRHVVHRDIKPSNLLINSAGDVKISDFGISKEVDHTAATCTTFVGTTTYMSPERLMGEGYSASADIWALGLCIMEAALGRFPYDIEDGMEKSEITFWKLLQAIKTQPPPVLPYEYFSPEFCHFCSACLQLNPEDRPSTTELLNHPFILGSALRDVNIWEWYQENASMTEEPVASNEEIMAALDSSFQ